MVLFLVLSVIIYHFGKWFNTCLSYYVHNNTCLKETLCIKANTVLWRGAPNAIPFFPNGEVVLNKALRRASSS